jgi:transposase
VRITLRFCRTTVKLLTAAWQAALRRGDQRLIKRITALLLLADGHPVPVVAERVGAGESTVYAWLQAFLLARFASLRYRRPPGRPAKLTASQKQRLQAVVSAAPEAAGYPTGCWNSALVQDWIWREYGVLYNVHYLSELLHNLGFSYQKGRFVSDHLDEARRQRWLTEVWPKIVQEARRKGAFLLFADEASFAQWGSLGYTWAPKGKQPVVKTCGKRKGYKIFGLIDYFSGRLFWRGQTERFTAERYCAFLATVLAATARPIILVQDGACYHTAATTRAFIAAQAERLTVYQLPSYSPDYNPIEHLWRNVKRDRTHNRYFATFAELMQEVDAALTHYQTQPGAVLRLMGTCLDKLAEPTAAQAPVAQAA